MTIPRLHTLAALALLAASAPAAVTNWPAWRGEGMTGRADGAGLPVTFGATQNLRWRIETPGRGESTPVIWGDRLFLLTAQPATAATDEGTPPANAMAANFGIRTPTVPYAFDVVCLDRHTGKTLWRTTVRKEVPHEGTHPDHGFASGSPVTDGRHLWAFFGSRGLHCLTMDGALTWSRDLGRMTMRVTFGEATSPALAGRAVIALLDQEAGSAIAAVDRDRGEVLWRKPRDEASSWTTPLVVGHGGKLQAIVSGTNRTRSYDPETGNVNWECGGQTVNVIPTPVPGDGVVYCSSGFRGNAVQAIALGRTGDLTGTDAVKWELKRNAPYVPSPVLSGTRLFFVSGTQPKLSCVDAATGTVLFDSQRIEGMKSIYASPIVSDGRLYLPGRDGTVAVIRDAGTFEVLALNRLEDGFDASPAVAGRDLYLRGKKHVYCFRAP